MRRSLPAKLAKAGDVSEKALVILQLTVPYRYRRSPWSRPDASSRETPQLPDVEVDL